MKMINDILESAVGGKVDHDNSDAKLAVDALVAKVAKTQTVETLEKRVKFLERGHANLNKSVLLLAIGLIAISVSILLHLNAGDLNG